MITADQKFLLNHMNITAQKSNLGDELQKTKNVLKCMYDFSVQGGAVSSINLFQDIKTKLLAQLPSKAVIINSFIDVVTNPTSGGGATIALTSGESAADVLAATAFGSVTGFVQGIQNNAVANFKKTTALRTVQAVIAAAALTAGKFNLYLEYVLSD